MKYDIVFPVPHSKQRDFIGSNAKRKIIVAGRRAGKTTGISVLASTKALQGRRVLEAAPTQEQTNAFWEAVKSYFQDPIANRVIYKNETERILKFPNGGRIRCKTAWDADTLRGDYADFLILDEFSFMSATAWDEVGAPMLIDNDGDAVFIFTPKRKNHAFVLYNRALSDGSRWQAWHFTTYDNPYLSKDALAEITSDMTERAYRQEILAEFLEGEGTVFRNITACMHAPPNSDPADHKGHRIVAGIDWGKFNNFTATSFGCTNCHIEVAKDRYNKIDYAFQRDRLKVLFMRWKPEIIVAETNSMGTPNFEMLQRDGFPVIGFETTYSSKPPLIQGLALALENQEWQFQQDPIWTGELEAFEEKVNPQNSRSTYAAPQGLNDDTVMARALMLFGTGRVLTGQLFY